MIHCIALDVFLKKIPSFIEKNNKTFSERSTSLWSNGQQAGLADPYYEFDPHWIFYK